MTKRILAIETSCDETAIAIADFLGPQKTPLVRALSHIVLSQISVHQKFGGVVPNLARREHEKNLVPILASALHQAGMASQKPKPQKLRIMSKVEKELDSILSREPELLGHFKKYVMRIPPPKIDEIAVTYGPGLAPALWVGVNFARALAYLWKKPLIPVNHMEGHLFSALLQQSRKEKLYPIPYTLNPLRLPALALLVSGGHTELILMRGFGKYKLIGETLDDAAGEAFDKVARILGLKYPGGPEISRMAERGNASKYPLPSPMINSKDYNFSFSGLKTAVFYLVRDLGRLGLKQKQDMAASFEKAVVDVLIKKTIRAAKEYNVKTLLLGGGVAANRELRKNLTDTLKKDCPASDIRLPTSDLTGDNALMIATAANFSGKKMAWTKVQADANVKLENI